MSDSNRQGILPCRDAGDKSETTKAKLVDRNISRGGHCARLCCEMGEYISHSQQEGVAVALLGKNRTRRHIKRGETLFKQGEKAQGIYSIQSGHFLLSHTNVFGHRTAFCLAGAGELLGYRSFFGADGHAATAQALSDSHVCCFGSEDVLRVVDSSPKFARQFLKILATDRGPSDALYLRGQQIPVRVRLLYLLVILEQRYGKYNDKGQLTLHLPLSRRDMASLLGVRHESITRTINQFKKEGMAIFKGRDVIVPDWSALIEATNPNIHTRS